MTDLPPQSPHTAKTINSRQEETMSHPDPSGIYDDRRDPEPGDDPVDDSGIYDDGDTYGPK